MMIMNVIFINDGACDGVFRQFWLTVLLFIKAIKLSHFIGMWMTFLLWITEDCSPALDKQITLSYDMEVLCHVLIYCVS